jgi:outer membrane lipase/esterase
LAEPFDHLLVFGDSLSDPGNIEVLRFVPDYASGRFSNGPTYAEQLPGQLGIEVVDNVAVGGATTGSGNVASEAFFGLGEVLGLPGVEQQVDGFVASGQTLDEDDLVIVYGGGNDVLAGAEANLDLAGAALDEAAAANAAIATANLAGHVRKLSAVGGDFYIMPNLPDIGRTPRFAEAGSAVATAFADAHNEQLAAGALDLQRETGADILVFDVHGLFNDMLADPGRYGLANTADPCVDRLLDCRFDGDAQATSLFWDDIHPTTAGHDVVAEVLSATLQAATVTIPSTAAAAGDVNLVAGQDFQRSVLAGLRRSFATASVALGRPDDPALQAAEANGLADAGLLDDRLHLYILADRTSGDREARPGAAAFDYDLDAVTAGVRFRATPTLDLGLALRGAAGDVELAGSLGEFDQRDVQLGLGASLGVGGFALSGLASAGRVALDNLERNGPFEGLDTEAETDGWIYGAAVTADYQLGGELLKLAPAAAFRYLRVDLDSYTEAGEDFIAQRLVDEGEVSSAVGSLGVHADLRLDITPALPIRLHAAAAFEHEFEDGERMIEVSAPGADTTITTAVAPIDQDVVRLGADVAVALLDRMELGAAYETVVGLDGGSEHTVSGRLTVPF